MQKKRKSVKKFRCLFLAVVLMFSFCIQGCSIKEAETSHNIYHTDNTKTKITIEMKADKSQGYQWKFYTETGMLIKSSVDLDRDDVLSETRITKCTFKPDESGKTDVIYMVLIKNGDIDAAKAYAYPISVDENEQTVIGAMTEYTVGLNPQVKAKVSALQ